MKKQYVSPETKITVVSNENILTGSLTYQSNGDGGSVDGSLII